jgi:hypothetical protein
MFRNKRSAVVRIFAAALLAIGFGLVPFDRVLDAANPLRIGTAAESVKEGLHGLISMGVYGFTPNTNPKNTIAPVEQKRGLLQGIAIIASWRDLEATATSGLARNNEIDQGLELVRRYNMQYPNTPLAVKIRVWGASWAPAWVMAASGGQFSVTHTNVHGKESQRILGHVWSAVYRGYWQRLQQQLAARYDGDPLVREVSVNSCMMFTAEPFFIDKTKAAVDGLRANGLTDADYKACLDGIFEDYAPWRRTRFETPLNPFTATDTGTAVQDPNFTLAWMDRCAKYGARCVYDNHDLTAPSDVSQSLLPIYAKMKNSNQEVEFQTFKASPTDLDAVISNGVQMGASSIELYQDYGGFPDISDADLRKYAEWLLRNRVR